MAKVFGPLCAKQHKALMAGKCPWCGEDIIEGRPYRFAEGLIGLGDEWLAKKLEELRGGDKRVLSELTMACIRLFMETLQPWVTKHGASEWDVNRARLAGTVKEFNQTICDVAERFAGTSVYEFWELARQELTLRWKHILGNK